MTVSYTLLTFYVMHFFAFFAGNEYHQYDFFVYPKVTEVEKHGFWEGGIEWVSSFFTDKDDSASEEFIPPSTEEMVKRCLNHYLQPFKSALLNKKGYHSDFRLDEFVRQVRQIFEQHNEPAVQHKHKSCVIVTVNNLKEVMTSMYIQSAYPNLILYTCCRSIKDG